VRATRKPDRSTAAPTRRAPAFLEKFRSQRLSRCCRGGDESTAQHGWVVWRYPRSLSLGLRSHSRPAAPVDGCFSPNRQPYYTDTIVTTLLTLLVSSSFLHCAFPRPMWPCRSSCFFLQLRLTKYQDQRAAAAT
jgi:hypothetical protein